MREWRLKITRDGDGFIWVSIISPDGAGCWFRTSDNDAPRSHALRTLIADIGAECRICKADGDTP